MPWGRLDDGLYDHPKLDALGRSKLAAVGLWTLAISWSNRRLTDGFVPTDRVLSLGGTPAIADLLVAAGLFDQADGGYVIHDFLTFNESREHVESRREADRNRKRKADGLHDDSARKPSGLQSTPPRARGPGPARPSDSPQPPASGGRPSRANGTSPRAKADAARAVAELERKAKAWRANERKLAYLRGAITDEQRIEMNERDAPVAELPRRPEDPARPDWAQPAEVSS